MLCFKTLTFSLTLGFMITACGVEPSAPNVVHLGGEKSEPPVADQGSDATAKPQNDQFATLMKASVVKACHDRQVVFDRMQNKCSDSVHLATFTCDFEGIVAAFSGAGIKSALREAVGNPDGDKDQGLGFEIDQCGQTDEGHTIVYLVKKDFDKKEPILKLRELETVN